MAEDLSGSYYVIGVTVFIKVGKYSFSDYEVAVTRKNINTGAEVTKKEGIADALEDNLRGFIKSTGAGVEFDEVKFSVRDDVAEKKKIQFDLNFIRSAMDLPPGTFDSATGRVTPGPAISPSYTKAYGILQGVEDTIKKTLTTAYENPDSSNWKGRDNQKSGLPKPMTFEFESIDDPVQNTWFKGDGGWRIVVKVNNVDLDPGESYVPDTTPFKRRGLVKIQGQEDYRAAGQIIGKDLTANPSSVASDNQTHVNGVDNDEQVENSIAVSIWYFKNKTTGDVNTVELKSKLPKSNYVNEYQRIKGIMG